MPMVTIATVEAMLAQVLLHLPLLLHGTIVPLTTSLRCVSCVPLLIFFYQLQMLTYLLVLFPFPFGHIRKIMDTNELAQLALIKI